MRLIFWRFVHNAIIHPLMGVLQWEPRWLERAAFRTAERAWPDAERRTGRRP